MHAPADLAGRGHFGSGRLDDGLAIAPGQDAPCGAEVHRVVVLTRYAGVPEFVDLRLGFAGLLADLQDLRRDAFEGGFRGESEALLPIGLLLRRRGPLAFVTGFLRPCSWEVDGAIERRLDPDILPRLGFRPGTGRHIRLGGFQRFQELVRVTSAKLEVSGHGDAAGRFGHRRPLPPGFLGIGEQARDPGGLCFHGPPHPGEPLVPLHGFVVAGGPGLVLLPGGVLEGGAHLQPGQAQFPTDVRRRPAGLLQVGGALQPKLRIAAPAQVDAVDPAECPERGVPVGPGLR